MRGSDSPVIPVPSGGTALVASQVQILPPAFFPLLQPFGRAHIKKIKKMGIRKFQELSSRSSSEPSESSSSSSESQSSPPSSSSCTRSMIFSMSFIQKNLHCHPGAAKASVYIKGVIVDYPFLKVFA